MAPPPYHIPRTYPVYITPYEAEIARRFLAFAMKAPPPELADDRDACAAVFAKLTHVVQLDEATKHQ